MVAITAVAATAEVVSVAAVVVDLAVAAVHLEAVAPREDGNENTHR